MAHPATTSMARQVIELTLPYPISANDYWRSMVPKGWTRAIVHLSTEAKHYKRDVGWLAKAAGFRTPTTKPIALNLTLHPKGLNKNGQALGVTMDLSNCLKVAEDALQGIVYVNDRQVKSISMRYGEKTNTGALVVQIEELAIPQAELFPEPLEEQIGTVTVRPPRPPLADALKAKPF